MGPRALAGIWGFCSSGGENDRRPLLAVDTDLFLSGAAALPQAKLATLTHTTRPVPAVAHGAYALSRRARPSRRSRTMQPEQPPGPAAEAIEDLYNRITGDEDARVCKDIPESAP